MVNLVHLEISQLSNSAALTCCQQFVKRYCLNNQFKIRKKIMRIIGIDPGLRRTGWGVINFDGMKLKHVSNGVCKSDSSKNLALRLLEIYDQLREIVKRYQPKAAAVENTFVSKDPLGALKLGHARGIALLVPAEFEIPVFEYAPNTIKKLVVGAGHADKKQVEYMVKLQLPGVLIKSVDSSDALAIALCHAYQSNFKGRLDDAISKAGIGR